MKRPARLIPKFLRSLLSCEEVLIKKPPHRRESRLLKKHELSPIIEMLSLHINSFLHPKPFFGHLQKRKLPAPELIPARPGRPREVFNRDNLALSIHQTLSTPRPSRPHKGKGLPFNPLLPPHCFGFIRSSALVKKIMLGIGQRAPSNLRVAKNRVAAWLKNEGLFGTAHRFSEDTRQNRRLNKAK